MKIVTQDTTDTWLSGVFVGDKRPMVRATIQKMNIRLFTYDLAKIVGSERKGTGKFASAPFGQPQRPVELPNVKSMRWQRSIDQDVATCTIELYNTRHGGNSSDTHTLDVPGYYTANRGDTGNRWGDTKNGWRDLIVPDRIVRTYEGYGFDHEQPPENDPNLYPSGVWLIDRVVYSPHLPIITLECRDLGRLLIDHIMFPPVVPWHQYPLEWEQIHPEPRKRRTVTTGWRKPRYQTDSNIPYIGTGITDGGRTYVNSDGTVYGHHGKDAFDTSNSTYWLSVGNRPTWSSAYEYVQGAVTGTVHAVKVKVWGGPYHGYISVKTDKGWQGSKRIPYRHRVIDTDADIPFVKSFDIDKNDELTIDLPKSIEGAVSLRVTFTNLYNSGLGTNYRYRAGVYNLEYNSTAGTVTTYTKQVGDYSDYTDIIKWLTAWGGFYWPTAATGLNYQHWSNGNKEYLTAANDPVFGTGRVWGDFEPAGVAGEAKLELDIWDKKPLMDGIAYVRDILGYEFHIAEDGGVVWRSPNVFKLGNYIYAPATGQNGGRTTQIPVIDERQTLLDVTPTLSSANIREKIFVGDINGKKEVAATSAGFIPKAWRSGMRRVGGWTDQHFETKKECQIMADMITLRQSFEIRVNSLTITANPALQIDDQVRIFERITGEHYYHRIRGITSEWDIETGRWTYTLETHWLGESPFDRWAFNPAELAADTKAYLEAMGRYTQ